jgi:hypothetical protein
MNKPTRIAALDVPLRKNARRGLMQVGIFAVTMFGATLLGKSREFRARSSRR